MLMLWGVVTTARESETEMPPEYPVIDAVLVMYPLGFVALYGVKPSAVVT